MIGTNGIFHLFAAVAFSIALWKLATYSRLSRDLIQVVRKIHLESPLIKLMTVSQLEQFLIEVFGPGLETRVQLGGAEELKVDMAQLMAVLVDCRVSRLDLNTQGLHLVAKNLLVHQDKKPVTVLKTKVANTTFSQA